MLYNVRQHLSHIRIIVILRQVNEADDWMIYVDMSLDIIISAFATSLTGDMTVVEITMSVLSSFNRRNLM